MAHISRFSTCSVDNCGSPGVRGGSCTVCRNHLCIRHRSKEYHDCPSPAELTDDEWDKSIDDEIEALLARVNTTELAQRASRLNKNKACVFEPGRHRGDGAIMGCANYHGWLVFEDGERWLARIPRDAFTDLPPDLVEYIITSEYATLKFLEGTKVPGPKGFRYALASNPDNLVRVTYLLIEALPGKPYYQYLATPEQTARVLGQLAEILIELSNHPLPKAGSLLPVPRSTEGTDVEVRVGPLASNRFLHHDQHLGPFSTGGEYFSSVAAAYMDILADNQLVQSDPEGAKEFYRAIQTHAPALGALSSVQPHKGQQFFLKHVDDKGDHILVDEEYNIVGIIDWQFARVVPAAEAFGPSLVTADMGVLYEGTRASALTSEDKIVAQAFREKGRPDLARYMEGSTPGGGNELMRRIQFGIPAGSSAEETKQVLDALLSELGELKG